jgi:hypothetical protein
MNQKESFCKHGNLNLNILFELLSHKETNYGFFAVSRIKVLSQIIGILLSYPGQKKTREELIPELKKFVTNT